VALRNVIITEHSGLHARAAARFVKAAAAARMPVTIRKPDGEPVPASSILSVLALGAVSGDEVVLEAHGDHAERALDTLVPLLARSLDA